MIILYFIITFCGKNWCSLHSIYFSAYFRHYWLSYVSVLCFIGQNKAVNCTLCQRRNCLLYKKNIFIWLVQSDSTWFVFNAQKHVTNTKFFLYFKYLKCAQALTLNTTDISVHLSKGKELIGLKRKVRAQLPWLILHVFQIVMIWPFSKNGIIHGE